MPHPIKRKPTRPTTVIVSNPALGSSDTPNQGRFMMFYSEPGEGKTTLAAQFDNPLFIITHGETGIDSAKRIGVASKDIPVVRLSELFQTDSIPDGGGHPGYVQCIDTLNVFAEGGHGRKTVVVDTLSGMEQLALQHCASMEFKGDMQGRGQDEWNAWSAGPRRMCEGYWLGEFIPACLRCIEAGYDVILLAHCTLRNVPNPNGPDFTVYQPDLAKGIFNATSKSLQYMFFLGRDREFVTDTKTKKRTVSATNRFIGVTNDTWYLAKNWHNLQSPVFCGESAAATYNNLMKEMGND